MHTYVYTCPSCLPTLRGFPPSSGTNSADCIDLISAVVVPTRRQHSPELLSVMAAVFPLEIYEHIMELGVEDEVWEWMMLDMLVWSRVCRAWRRYCVPFIFKTKLFSAFATLDTLYSFRRYALLWPHLASLVEGVEVEQAITEPYDSKIEMLPIVVYPHLPRLRRVIMYPAGKTLERLHTHRCFRITHRRFEGVTELTLVGVLLRDTSDLCVHLAMFPQTRTLCLDNVWWTFQGAWPRTSQSFVPPIADLDLRHDGRTVSLSHKDYRIESMSNKSFPSFSARNRCCLYTRQGWKPYFMWWAKRSPHLHSICQ